MSKRITREDIERDLTKIIQPVGDLDAWEKFVDYVFESDWWATNSEINDAWTFFEAGYLAAEGEEHHNFPVNRS